MLLGLLACCAFIAAVYVTGVHDASNAVAVPVRTRALGERSALYLAALFNVLAWSVRSCCSVSIPPRG